MVQSGAVCCSVLQCAAECLTCCDVDIELRAIAGFHVLQCAATWCNVLQCVAICCSALQCIVVCYSVLQCVAQ
jgi:hypothetical protein